MFGTAASANIDLDALIENKEITLISVQYLYVFVGALFLLASSIFYFSKSIPQDKEDSSFLGAKKAMISLVLITIGLIIIFSQIFSQYIGVEGGELSKESDDYILKLSFLALILVVGVLLVSNSLARKKSEGWGAYNIPNLFLE